MAVILWNIQQSTLTHIFLPCGQYNWQHLRSPTTRHFNELTFMECNCSYYRYMCYVGQNVKMKEFFYIIQLVLLVRAKKIYDFKVTIDGSFFSLTWYTICLLPMLTVLVQHVQQASLRLPRETTSVCSARLTAEPPAKEQLLVSVATTTTALTPTLHRCPAPVCIQQ